MMFHLLGKQKRSGKWLTSITFDYNYDDLCQLMLLGEAKQWVQLYLITHVNDTIIDTFSVTAVVSDNYAHSLVFFILSHKRNFQCQNSGHPIWINKYQNTESTDQPT